MWPPPGAPYNPGAPYHPYHNAYYPVPSPNPQLDPRLAPQPPPQPAPGPHQPYYQVPVPDPRLGPQPYPQYYQGPVPDSRFDPRVAPQPAPGPHQPYYQTPVPDPRLGPQPYPQYHEPPVAYSQLNARPDPRLYGYFTSNGVAPQASKDKDNLLKLFEKYREPGDEESLIGVGGTMRYLGDLGVNLENAEWFVPLEIIQAPAMGEIAKDGFVNGWRDVGADTISKQKSYVANQIAQLRTDNALFKRVYRYAFFCKERGQKALALDNALVYWECLFNTPGKPLITNRTNWTAEWLEFLRNNWSKTVNKDMWNQTLEFFMKVMEDETLSFWSEDGAWPGVVDEFVVYAKKKRGDPEVMETD